MIKLTEEQKNNVTKNAELFLQIYEETKRAAISYGLPREEWHSFTTVFILADIIGHFIANQLSRDFDAKVKELRDIVRSLEEALKEISGRK